MEEKQRERVSRPKSPEYEAVVRAGSHVRPLKQAHAHLVVSGRHRSVALLTKLVTQSCAAGSIDYTRRLFRSVTNPDSFLFNSIIKASSHFGFSLDTLFFYRHMLYSSIKPSSYTFTSLFKACAHLSALRVGTLIHSHVFVSGYASNPFVQAAIVAFYAKSSALQLARKVFEKMPQPSVVAWNSMISGYEQNGLANEAMTLFHKMRESGVCPDSATYVSVSSACSQMGSLELGCWVHDNIISNGIRITVILGTSLINSDSY